MDGGGKFTQVYSEERNMHRRPCKLSAHGFIGFVIVMYPRERETCQAGSFWILSGSFSTHQAASFFKQGWFLQGFFWPRISSTFHFSNLKDDEPILDVLRTFVLDFAYILWC